MTSSRATRSQGLPLHKVDLHLTKDIKLGGTAKVQLVAEVFNLFNHGNFGSYNTSLSPTACGDDRAVRHAEPEHRHGARVASGAARVQGAVLVRGRIGREGQDRREGRDRRRGSSCLIRRLCRSCLRPRPVPPYPACPRRFPPVLPLLPSFRVIASVLLVGVSMRPS